MKGIINKGLQEFIEDTLGPEKWEEIKAAANCDEPFFALSFDYPDSMTVDLIQAAASLSSKTPEAVMEEYGRYIVSASLKKYYPTYFALCGNSTREFLLNMNRIHHEVTNQIMNALPPTFDYLETNDNKLQMIYQSQRRLCSILKGLILGVGDYFDEELVIEKLSCQSQGDPACIYEITFTDEK